MATNARFTFTVDIIEFIDGQKEITPFENRVDVRDEAGTARGKGLIVASTADGIGEKDVISNGDGTFYVPDLPTGIYSVGLATSGGEVSFEQDELQNLPHTGNDLLWFYLTVRYEDEDGPTSKAGALDVIVDRELMTEIDDSNLGAIIKNINDYLVDVAHIDDTAQNADDAWSSEKIANEIASSVLSTSDFIDDSAGSGDNSKVLSANKMYDILGTTNPGEIFKSLPVIGSLNNFKDAIAMLSRKTALVLSHLSGVSREDVLNRRIIYADNATSDPIDAPTSANIYDTADHTTWYTAVHVDHNMLDTDSQIELNCEAMVNGDTGQLRLALWINGDLLLSDKQEIANSSEYNVYNFNINLASPILSNVNASYATVGLSADIIHNADNSNLIALRRPVFETY